MKKNNCLLTTLLLLGLTFSPLNKALADNNLVQLDLKKGSGNAVDVTFFTSENYSGNVIVRKKSDNKYVILMPKVLTSGYRTTDLESVHGLVSNIDVKSIDDGVAGYTKITMITTKPLEITTQVTKAEPLSEAQKAYKTLIAEAHTVKNNINTTTVSQPTHTTEVATNQVPTQLPTIQKSETKPKILLTPVDTQKLVSEKPTNKVEKNITNTVKTTTNNIEKHLPNVPAVQPTPVLPSVENIDDTIQDVKVIKEQNKQQNLSQPSLISKIKGKVQEKMPTGIITTLILILAPLMALIAFCKLVSSSLKSSRALKKSFLERISKQPRQKDYEHIINNENLNWQEKYQLFLNQSGKDEVSAVAQSNKYKFVQKTENTIKEQRQKLEQLVTPEIIEEVDNTPVSSENVKVHTEENTIAESLKEASKIKAFEPALNYARRSVKKLPKSRFKRFATKADYEEISQPIEQQTTTEQPTLAELEKSPLSTNPRSLADANLKVTDVIKDDYLMSSLDEFLEISENTVADTLAQIKPSMKMVSSTMQSEITNPIEVKRATSPTFSGLIVKTGYNIDAERGFYIVNLDGTSALIGRIREDIFVLKKFDDTSDKRLQVRHDKDNVYVVKTEGFKSLVDANNMGVLIEL